MKRIFSVGVMLALAIFVSNVFAQQTGMNSNSNAKMSGKMNSDAKFMMMAATSDMNEIGLSQYSSGEIIQRRR